MIEAPSRKRRARDQRGLFPVNVWPPLVDALTLVLAAFVLIMLVVAVAQRALIKRLGESEVELERLRADKARIERRLKALAPAGLVEVDDGKVILQGEILFDSGADELRPEGVAFLRKMGPALASVLAAEPDQMVLIGGHTDDVPIHGPRFASNWELSTARAVAVVRVLTGAGVPPAQIVAAGFGDSHPRVPNADADSRRRNRRIEVLLVPIKTVSSR